MCNLGEFDGVLERYLNHWQYCVSDAASIPSSPSTQLLFCVLGCQSVACEQSTSVVLGMCGSDENERTFTVCRLCPFVFFVGLISLSRIYMNSVVIDTGQADVSLRYTLVTLTRSSLVWSGPGKS